MNRAGAPVGAAGVVTGGPMDQDETEDTTIYRVVVNHEAQYSIWPSTKTLPLGWNDVGKQGSKVECLAYIEEVWTDMRPLSLRQAAGS